MVYRKTWNDYDLFENFENTLYMQTSQATGPVRCRPTGWPGNASVRPAGMDLAAIFSSNRSATTRSTMTEVRFDYIFIVMFDQVCKCLFSDGLVDCEDPECCENPVCERSQLCHTVSAPIGEIAMMMTLLSMMAIRMRTPARLMLMVMASARFATLTLSGGDRAANTD